MGEKIFRLFSASPFCVFGGLKKTCGFSILVGLSEFYFCLKMPLNQMNYSLLFYLNLEAIRPDFIYFPPSTVAPAGYIHH